MRHLWHDAEPAQTRGGALGSERRSSVTRHQECRAARAKRHKTRGQIRLPTTQPQSLPSKSKDTSEPQDASENPADPQAETRQAPQPGYGPPNRGAAPSVSRWGCFLSPSSGTRKSLFLNTKSDARSPSCGPPFNELRGIMYIWMSESQQSNDLLVPLASFIDAVAADVIISTSANGMELGHDLTCS